MTKKRTGVLDAVQEQSLCVEDILEAIKKTVPLKLVRQQGVYFLIKGTVVGYVGKTTNLYDRLSKHHRLKHYHRVSFLPVLKISQLDTIETSYIRAFQPQLNVKGKL